MRRRDVLVGAGGALAGLPGCLYFRRESATPPVDIETSTDSEGTPAGEDAGTPTGTPSGSFPMGSDSMTYQRGYVAVQSGGGLEIAAGDTEFVVVDLEITGRGGYPRSAFSLVESGDGSGSGGLEPTTVERFYRTVRGSDAWYERGRTRGLLLFEVPEGFGPEVWLDLPDDGTFQAHAVPAQLRTPPPTVASSLSVQTTGSSSDAGPTVAVTVTNESESLTDYVGGIERSDEGTVTARVGRVSGRVSGGRTRTFEVVDDRDRSAPGDDQSVAYRLVDQHGGDDVEFSPE